MDQYVTQMVVGWLSALFIQFLKRVKSLPWIDEHTDDVNRIIAVVVAFFASLGIGFEFIKDAGTLLISGLTLNTLMSLGWNWIVQFFFQNVIYRIAVKPPVTTTPLKLGN